MIDSAVLTIANDGDILITLQRPSTLEFDKPILVVMQERFLKIGQNKVCHASIEITDETMETALKAAIHRNGLVVVEVDDDGFNFFSHVKTKTL